MPFIRGAAVALRLPQGFGQRLHQRVLGAVLIAQPRLQRAQQFADTGRPVDGYLLADREMQRHM